MADQPSLLDQLVTGERDAEVAEAIDRARARAEERDRSKGGRPAGRANRRTRDLERLVCEQAGHPVLAMARLYAQPVEALARRLGCKLAEAADLQLRAAKEVAPYVAQRQPQAVQIDTTVQVPVVLADPRMAGEASAAMAGGQRDQLSAVLDATFALVTDQSDDGDGEALEPAETLASQRQGDGASDGGRSDGGR